jgi:hypothetical protein
MEKEKKMGLSSASLKLPEYQSERTVKEVAIDQNRKSY